MKKLIALLLAVLMLFSGCAKPDVPEENENVTPGAADTPQAKSEWYNAEISDDLRRQFFDLVKDYRVDAMYEFTPEQPMELEWFKWYCAYFVAEEDKTYVSGGVNYTGKAVEEIAKRFGVTYGLKDDDVVFLKADSLRDVPFAELIGYRKETVDGKTLITARCVNYSYSDYYYIDRVETELTYPARREAVIKGEATDHDGNCVILDFSFYTEDGTTPTQFVSFKEYPQWALEDGTLQLPEF
ncbi:MAG: hypothetical protein IJ043_08725 [Clostridia bacterium]|nr:hypothetical protein [Clostridia bacterium]